MYVHFTVGLNNYFKNILLQISTHSITSAGVVSTMYKRLQLVCSSMMQFITSKGEISFKIWKNLQYGLFNYKAEMTNSSYAINRFKTTRESS